MLSGRPIDWPRLTHRIRFVSVRRTRIPNKAGNQENTGKRQSNDLLTGSSGRNDEEEEEEAMALWVKKECVAIVSTTITRTDFHHDACAHTFHIRTARDNDEDNDRDTSGTNGEGLKQEDPP